ncbi:GNAT family N-acetyltransferase [Mesorhizobium sp. J18]|uniref:GNAT family N-acetyltransferase n=1 Tax=Mesorhizobium sp. J18 TaxID=935263 RepID=UPI0011A06E9A|nr:GNAT family N-acetyltransferase [Mesorhizobium sp. J18]
MTAPSGRHVHPPLGFRIAIMRAEKMPPAFYRFLYEQVGRTHHWSLRRDMEDDELRAVIHAEATEISVLYVDGSPAGFFELDTARKPDEVEIVYFGLVPDFQGRGLGAFFLSETVSAAWAHDPAKVTIHTNTLDSPRALQLYQKAGFTPVSWSEETIQAWD